MRVLYLNLKSFHQLSSSLYRQERKTVYFNNVMKVACAFTITSTSIIIVTVYI